MTLSKEEYIKFLRELYPAEMKNAPIWACSTLEKLPNGKLDKAPRMPLYNSAGKLILNQNSKPCGASRTNKTTWTTFEECARAVLRGDFVVMGYFTCMLPTGERVATIDIDFHDPDLTDEEVKKRIDFMKGIIEKIGGLVTVSVSGKGVHICVYESQDREPLKGKFDDLMDGQHIEISGADAQSYIICGAELYEEGLYNEVIESAAVNELYWEYYKESDYQQESKTPPNGYDAKREEYFTMILQHFTPDMLVKELPSIIASNPDDKELQKLTAYTGSYSGWVAVGQALHYECMPMKVWDAWSKTDRRPDEYDAKGIPEHWKSFGKKALNQYGKNGPLTGATITNLAKAFGWVSKKEQRQADIDEMMASAWGSKAKAANDSTDPCEGTALKPNWDELTKDDILFSEELLKYIYAHTERDRIQVLNRVDLRAKELKVFQPWQKTWKAFLQEKAKETAVNSTQTKADFPKLEELFNGENIEVYTGQWTASENGVFYLKQQGQGWKQEFASHFPILPTAFYKNVESDTERVEIAQFKNDEWTKQCFARSVIASQSKITSAADYGIEVTSDTAAALCKYIGEMVALNPHFLGRAIPSASHFGYLQSPKYKDEFLPYSTKASVDLLSGQNTMLKKALTSKQGTLEEWLDFMHDRMQKYYVLKLAILASLASVIVGKLGELPFMFYLWGQSEYGKSVANSCGASVWGDPIVNNGYVTSMSATKTGIEEMASMLFNIPYVADDLQNIKGDIENYDEIIYMVCNGGGKLRGKADGGLRVTGRWRNSFLLSGEDPILTNASGGGAINRVLDVHVTETNKAIEDGTEIINFIRCHHGTLGEKFVEAIKRRGDKNLRDMIEAYTPIIQMKGEDNQKTEKQSRAAAALVAAAVVLYEDFYKESNYKPDREIGILQSICKSETEISAGERAWKHVCGWHGKDIMKFSKLASPCYGYTDYDETYPNTTLVNLDVLNAELHQSLAKDYKSCESTWKAKGYLLPARIEPNGKKHWGRKGYAGAEYVRLNFETPVEVEGEKYK